MVEQFGKAEVADDGFESVVEEHVGGLHVPVNDLRIALLVKVSEAAGGADCDAFPSRPIKRRLACKGEKRCDILHS